MRILIHGGGLQGLSCGESLYKDHEIDVICDDENCLQSKFFKNRYFYNKSKEEYWEEIDIRNYDVIIPVSDKSISLHTRNKSFLLKYGVKIATPDPETLRIVEDKNLFMNFCKENNLPHPITLPLYPERIGKIIDKIIDKEWEIGYPALIKPNFSVGARGITRVENSKDLVEIFPEIFAIYGDCTLQEYIDNPDFYYNVMMYRNSKGQILGSVIIKIVRKYPIQAGSSACCISIENPELFEICKSTLDKLNWVGMADFDILQRLDNGEYKIIEINPRVPASLRSAYVSGVNFPEIIIRDAAGLEPKTYDYTPGKTIRVYN